jgi:hypothetical protein
MYRLDRKINEKEQKPTIRGALVLNAGLRELSRVDHGIE